MASSATPDSAREGKPPSATLDTLREVKALTARGSSEWLSTEKVCERVVALTKKCFWEQDEPGRSEIAAAKREIMRLLVPHFRISGYRASAVLVEACEVACCPTFAQALLDTGANVRETWNHGRTALHSSMRTDTAAILIAAGGDVDAIDLQSGSPLFHAVYFSAEMTALLLGAGADPNLLLDRGRTAMFEAILMLAEGTDPDASLIMLRHGARLDIRCEKGWGSAWAPMDNLLRCPNAYGWVTAAEAAAYKAGETVDTTGKLRSSYRTKSARVPVSALLVEEAAWFRRRHLMAAARVCSA